MKRVLEVIVGLGILFLATAAWLSGWFLASSLPFYLMVGIWAFAVAIGIVLILGKWKLTGVGPARNMGVIVLFTGIGMVLFVAGVWITFWNFL